MTRPARDATVSSSRSRRRTAVDPDPRAAWPTPVAAGSIAWRSGATAVGVRGPRRARGRARDHRRVLAAPVYPPGYLVSRARRRRADRSRRPPVDATPPRWRRSTTCSSRSTGKVPDDGRGAGANGSPDTVRQTIPRLDQLGGSAVQAHAVVRTATSYLPEAVAAYLRLPRDFADRRRGVRAARRR